MVGPVIELKNQIVEYIEVAIAELREIALPRDIAQLRELGLDAEDAEDEEQLAAIRTQAENLRAFCEKRAKSTAGFKRL